MKRRSRAGGKPNKAQRRKTPEPKRRDAPKAVARSNSPPTSEETEVARLTRELNEARERQTATLDVLQVISSSPPELEPVFQTMLANATRLCNASHGAMWLCQEDGLRTVALHGSFPEVYLKLRREGTVVRFNSNIPGVRAIRSQQPIQVNDLREDQAYLSGDAVLTAAVQIGGIRTLAAVPMFQHDRPVGNITIYRQEVRPFTDKQIELVKNFAAQAVIAIENARLLNELRQSLEQQTATAEVLKVVSSLPDDLEPVFAAMLERAVRICDAKFGNIYRWDGEVLNAVASRGTPSAFVDARQRILLRPGPKDPVGVMIAT
jgi:transcriptional regulator with GAF, ATPase, and Fis domain